MLFRNSTCNDDTPLILFLTLCVVMLTVPAHSEVVEGFRDLQFGMTEEDVVALEACQTSAECIYELAGKNRYLQTLYAHERGTIQSGSPSSGTRPAATLSRITIDMGAFTDEWYGQLQLRLADTYELTHDLTESAITTFQANESSELVSGYENGQILLKVVRRKFGNVILNVVYQTKSMAAESLKELAKSR